MNLSSPLFTIFEIALTAFVIWALFNEDRFIAFEERIAARFQRRRFRVIKGGNNVGETYCPEKHGA